MDAHLGRLLGRLEDDRVAREQRREDLPRRHGEREVPRRDHADDADGHAHAHRPLVRHLARRRDAVHAAALAGGEVRHVDALLHVAARLDEDLAHLARRRLRQHLLVLGDRLAEPIEQLATLRRGRELPRAHGTTRGLDRVIEIVRPGIRERTEDLAGRGVEVLEGAPRTGRDPLPADVVEEGLRHGRSMARVGRRARIAPDADLEGCGPRSPV